MHPVQTSWIVVLLLAFFAPSIARSEQAEDRGLSRGRIIDFGELRAGEKVCRPTGLPEGWVLNTYPMPDFPRGVKMWGFWHGPDLCLKADLWAPPSEREIAGEVNVNYLVRLRQRLDDQRVPATIRLVVRRPIGVRHLATVLWFPVLVLLVAVVVWRRRPGFERKLHIAYRIETETGYRAAGQREWQFVAVESLPGGRRRFLRRQAVSVEKALEPDASLKPVLLEPFPEKEVMVRASMPMMIQAIGEPTARTATNEATISPGTVVRAGRLLFALLTPELLESVREGRVELPTPGSGGEEGRASVVEGLRARLIKRRPGFWGWLLLALGPAAAGFLFALTGLVTDGTSAFFAVGVVMAITVIVLQALRSRLGI